VSKKSGSGSLRYLDITQLVFNQAHPVIIAEIDAGKFERRLIAALLEWARIVVEREQRQETLIAAWRTEFRNSGLCRMESAASPAR
jgi:hypothetical protein